LTRQNSGERERGELGESRVRDVHFIVEIRERGEVTRKKKDELVVI
jgi:hypothetical protein